MELKQDEIIYCNAKCNYKGKEYRLDKIVHKHTDGFYYKRRILEPFGIKEPVKLYDIEIINRLGFANKAKGYTEVKKSDETRNKITGAYE